MGSSDRFRGCNEGVEYRMKDIRVRMHEPGGYRKDERPHVCIGMRWRWEMR